MADRSMTVADQDRRAAELDAASRTRRLTPTEAELLAHLIECRARREALVRHRLPNQLKAARAKVRRLEARMRALGLETARG